LFHAIGQRPIGTAGGNDVSTTLDGRRSQRGFENFPDARPIAGIGFHDATGRG
jgi:hypothetical protein